MELIKPLSAAEIEQIRDRTEELLETVGLRVDHPGAPAHVPGRGRGRGRDGRAGAFPAPVAP